MIGFFPDPHPDELLYSVCARYHQRAMYRSRAATARDLFGNESAKIVIDLPSRLSHLMTVLPPGHGYSEERLIDEHTLLPFYAPFVPPERLLQLRQDMSGDERGSAIHGRIGILTSKIRLESLRFCPMCVEEDRRRYGETYWHRLHQAPGVMACPVHAVWLEQSSQHLSQLLGRKMLAAADQVVPAAPERFLDLRLRDHHVHLQIARDVDWLLNHRSGANRLDELHGHYLELLIDRCLATYAGVIWMRRLQTEFLDFYSTQFLDELCCGLSRRGNWLTRMVRASRAAQHPIQHLLLMRFLGYSAAEFFHLLETPQPFGAGPWPCLNPVCDCYRKQVITTCQVRTMQDGRLIGTFRCECGFSYRRRMPPERKREACANWIDSFGPVWEERLGELYRTGNQGYQRLARQLGVSPEIVKSQAARLGLVQRPGEEEGQPELNANALPGSHKRLSLDESAKRAIYRERLQRAMKENPAAGRTELKRLQPAAYDWLIKHDSQWFDAASPPRRPSSGPPSMIDWKQRDADFAAAARKAAENLRRTPGRPMRVSKSAIARESGTLAVVTKRAHLIPLTISVLEELSETVEECAIRRIQWAADSFRRESQGATYSQLVTQARICRSVEFKPEVQTTIREMLEALS
ncbi:MAG: TnsD family Tn7-like transposition protein, partial [Blastocatellia bacterium]